MSFLKELTVKDKMLWGFSILIVVISNMLFGQIDILTLVTSLIGVTSLIFAAKGNVITQILMIIFSILYGVIVFIKLKT